MLKEQKSLKSGTTHFQDLLQSYSNQVWYWQKNRQTDQKRRIAQK